MRDMLKRALSARRFVTVAVAYCVALQMLFAGGLASQHAALGLGSSDPAVICFGNVPAGPSDADGSGSAAVRILPCVVMGFAAAAPAPDALVAPIAPATESGRIAVPQDRQAPRASAHRSPRLSQGPPQA